MAEITEVTLAIEVTSEEVVAVAEGEVDGAMIAVIEAETQIATTEHQEMREVPRHFVMTEAVIATDGIETTALEVAEHHLPKAALVRPLMDLARPEMDHQI